MTATGAGLRARPLLWIAVGALVAGAIAQALIDPDVFTAGEATALAAALAVPQLAGVAVLAVVLGLRRTLGVRLGLIALGWGALVSIAVATAANTALTEALAGAGYESISASVSAPVNEEVAKLLGVLVVVWLVRPGRVSLATGLVAGFLVGAGFDVVENLGYAVNAGLDAGAGQSVSDAVLSSTADRLTNGTLLHALWTGIAGAALATALAAGDAPARRRGVAFAAGGLLAVLVLHAAWDLPELSPSSADVAVAQAVLYAVTLLAFVGLWVAGLLADRRLRRTGVRAHDPSPGDGRAPHAGSASSMMGR